MDKDQTEIILELFESGCRLYQHQRKMQEMNWSSDPSWLTVFGHKALQSALRSRRRRGRAQTLFVSKQRLLVLLLCLQQDYRLHVIYASFKTRDHFELQRKQQRHRSHAHRSREVSCLVVMVRTTVEVTSRRVDRLIKITSDHEH